jgi:3-oxoacyl-[acyl-carrier-protein] synthase II
MIIREPSTRAVVTGYGCVTALGWDAVTTWSALLAGASARAPITAIDVEGCRVTEGAQAGLPDIPHLSPKRLSRLSRASRLAIPAAGEALRMAGLLDHSGRSLLPRLEMSVSTTACGMEKGEEFLHALWKGKSRGNAALTAHYQAQQQMGEIHESYGFGGPVMIVANACAGGGNAIGHACDLIRSGMAEIVVAGGYDALCELVYAGFDSLQTLAPDACRPFDRGRSGLMLGEGAAFLVIESESHAMRRGASILGMVAGYGQTTDTHHLTQPAQDGAPLERAMRKALSSAGMEPSDIGYVNAHGTGTPFNDGAEARAFRRIFGDVSPVRLSSTKAALGHTLGAAGAIEGVLCLLTLESGCIPPQINVRDPEPDVAAFLAGRDERREMRAAMSVNLGFGGSNAAVLFSKN